MSGANIAAVPFGNPYLLPRQPFEALIARVGYRVAWMKAHTCACIFAGGGAQGRLPFPGQAQPECTQCRGVGFYWDTPSAPFRGGVSFMHHSSTPEEPGVRIDEALGMLHRGEPTLTIPFSNPFLPAGDPGQPTPVWQQSGTSDKFTMIDMQTRLNAVLQVSGTTNLPYQQNVVVAATGAVSIYNAVTAAVTLVSGYSVSGAAVLLPDGFPPGTNYIVEFAAATTFVAIRKAGGDPHIRPIAGGQINEPRKFQLQELDLWLRYNAPSAQNYAAPTLNY